MPTIEPNVTEEKLRLLLDEGHESDLLDFKDTCNLGGTRDRVELAKDVGAMQIAGGYIVLGANDQGQPTGLLTPEMCALLDESVIRKKIAKFLAEPFEIRAATHRIGGHLLTVIYVAPNAVGMSVFRADGNYEGGQAFRAGDVFVRHGSSSERWQQHDIDRIQMRMVERLKEAWLAEATEAMRALLRFGQGAQELASGPAGALDWRLDAQTFVATALEQLRRDDDIPLRLALDRMEVDAGAVWSTGFESELGTLLDRLTCLAAMFIRLNRDDWLDEALRRFLSIYAMPMRPGPITQAREQATLWLAMGERLEAVGGLAVRRGRWDAVRRIALLRTPGHEPYHPYLLRHIVVNSGRAGLLEPRDRKGVSLVSLARAVVDRLDCLRPDMANPDDRILDSICQFDFLAALAAIADNGSIDTKSFYTSFAYFFTERVESIADQLLRDPALRNAIFPSPDGDLAAALAALNRLARSEGVRFSGWDGFSGRTLEFIRSHGGDSNLPA